MNITHTELVAKLKKPGADIIATLTPEKADLWHMASCVLGEAGELLNAVNANDHANIVEELGDIEFYLEGLRANLQITRAEVTAEVHGFVFSALPICAGDLFDAVKKHVIYNKEIDMGKLLTALNAVESCLEDARQVASISYDETVAQNIAKLSERYKGLTYSDRAAQERADKQETN